MDKLKTILHKHQVHGKLRKELQALWMEDEHEKTVVGNLDEIESTTTNESETPAESVTLPEGYKTLGELGQGGMGKVLRVQDLGLNRSVAMKLLHPQLSDSKISKLRFIEEAQFCAKLQHPNIVPVYRLGRLQEKQYYFTMKEIDGRSLGSVIREVHQSLEDGKWRLSPSGWTFRRIIEVLHQVCNAMAYAHQHHVIHRDLKPENIMLGAYGEVLIIDWGIAKDLTTLPTQDPNGEFRDITGTPSYMAPEQARGEVHRLSPQSDIYSLGAILYEALTGGPPFNASTPLAILKKVVAGPPPALEESETSWFGFESMEQGSQRMPPELKTICNKAMERDPHQRYGCAVEMAKALQDWLNGLQKRAQAMEMVERSQQLQDEIYELLQQSGQLRTEAAALLENVPEWESDDKKLDAWDKQDEAKTLRETARLKELEREMLLHGALVHKSDLLEAHLELAAEYHKRHKEAEENSQSDRALHHETRLRVHLNHLPKQHRERYVSYIKGDGTLTIQTDNEESTFYLEPYQIQGRRLQCTTSRPIGKGSIEQLPIKMGSYRLRIITPKHQSIFYPFLITRKLNFDPASTRANKKFVIRIPKDDELDDMECYIPAGPFLYGGDPKAINGSSKQHIWLDAFVMQKYPVT
ncbi:MAG: serine/threonine-protein kinase, partial [Myxococcota bacterium]|nr:serine/threonine-protein kinase [Myxococcota bacterium]